MLPSDDILQYLKRITPDHGMPLLKMTIQRQLPEHRNYTDIASFLDNAMRGIRTRGNSVERYVGPAWDKVPTHRSMKRWFHYMFNHHQDTYIHDVINLRDWTRGESHGHVAALFHQMKEGAVRIDEALF